MLYHIQSHVREFENHGEIVITDI